MSSAGHPQTLERALSQVLKTLAEAEHPVYSASIWRYVDSVGGGFGWRVIETPPATIHGTDRKRPADPTDYDKLATQLLESIDQIRQREVDTS